MRQQRILIIIFTLLLLGSLANPFGLFDPVKSVFQRAFSPFIAVFQRVGLGAGNFTDTLLSINNLAKENEQLRIDNLEIQAENIKLRELEYENELITSELNEIKKLNYQVIPARIIAKSPTGFLDIITIDKGEKEGIKNHAAVISHGFLVGRVTKTTNHTSEVTLITSNTSKIPALLEQSRGTGLIQGGLQGLRIQDIQLDITPRRGEPVVTSDLGQIIPRNIPVGYIKEVITPESSMVQSASITSPVLFSKLEVVFVFK